MDIPYLEKRTLRGRYSKLYIISAGNLVPMTKREKPWERGCSAGSQFTLRACSQAKVDAIIQAPTADGQAYMVESETMAKPHYVSVAKNGKVTYTDCPGWSAFKICSHSLTVAEKNG
jgi:hypothetical protein